MSDLDPKGTNKAISEIFSKLGNIWICVGCKREYGEYVNGCTKCWDDDLSIDENRKKYPNRKVIRMIEYLQKYGINSLNKK